MASLKRRADARPEASFILKAAVKNQIPILVDLAKKAAAAETVREKTGRRYPQATEVVRQARRDAVAAAKAIEASLEEALGPLEDEIASPHLKSLEESLRLAIDSVVSPREKVNRIRKQAAKAAGKTAPILICRGNPLAGGLKEFDVLGPRGRGRIFRGQWRQSRKGKNGEPVSLGPRCESCNARITRTRERWKVAAGAIGELDRRASRSAGRASWR